MKIRVFREPLPTWNGLPLAGRIWIHPSEWWSPLSVLPALKAGAAKDGRGSPVLKSLPAREPSGAERFGRAASLLT